MPGKEPVKPRREVEVITTHVNADFDALASMLAAAKLYPEAVLVFPGAQERSLRNFFVESVCFYYNFVKVKDVDFSRVRRLILVDTRQKERIGPLGELADDPEVEVHAFDHHPDTENDVKADYQVVAQVGSTVTLLSRLMRARGVVLNEDDASLMALGIYEDTGNFTSVSTTTHDYEAAAWFLSQGASLSVISELITRELTTEEVALLHDMIHSAYNVNVGGVEVTISEVSRDAYIPDIAVLVHKFKDMENLDVVFILARMEGRVYLVARSRLAEVDVGKVAKEMGGGGHPTAASATLRDLTLVEARERLQAILATSVNPTRLARDLMSQPVITVAPDLPLIQAQKKLTRYNINVMPVMEGGALVGIITRQTVEKAIYHGLGDLVVSEYMTPGVEPISPDADLLQVEKAVLEKRQRLVAVMEEGRLIGVITRTDILNALIETPVIEESHPLAAEAGTGRQKNVAGLMRERFPRRVMNVLRELGAVGDRLGMKAYLVGGSVRDIFLRRENLDLDVVVEGDGIAFARAYAAGRREVRVRAHKKFNTAKLIFAEGLSIDVATARLEYYQSPAALPVVELSSIKLDLYRRDFTMNTLAVCINARQFGVLFDFFDAMRDIKEKAIRVLHNLSFVEDPTRVFRAVRFEMRFNFRIGKLTEALIRNARKIDAFQRLTGPRLFGELRNLLEEERMVACLTRLRDLKLLSVFHSKLILEPREVELLERVEEALAWYRLSFLGQPLRRWLAGFLGLADSLKDEDLMEVMDRLSLAPKLEREILAMRSQALESLNRLQRARPSPSQIHVALAPLKPEYHLYIMAKTTRDWVKRAVSQYHTTLQNVRPILDGRDLCKMGFTPGPVFKDILERLLMARLDGEVQSRLEEAALVAGEFNHRMDEKP